MIPVKNKSTVKMFICPTPERECARVHLGRDKQGCKHGIPHTWSEEVGQCDYSYKRCKSCVEVVE